MATSFTTWSALATAIKDDVASGAWRTRSYSTPTGQSVTYVTLKEMMDFLARVEALAAVEDGATSGVLTVADFDVED